MTDKRLVDAIAKGLVILSKYDKDGFGTCAEHDIIYAGPDAAGQVTAKDHANLIALGWHIDIHSDRCAKGT